MEHANDQKNPPDQISTIVLPSPESRSRSSRSDLFANDAASRLLEIIVRNRHRARELRRLEILIHSIECSGDIDSLKIFFQQTRASATQGLRSTFT